MINLDLPNVPETYVHRIGRTARAGRSGAAISFCDFEEVEYLVDIESTTRQDIKVDAEHPFHNAEIANSKVTYRKGGGGRPKSGGQKSGGQNRGGQNRGPQGQGQGGRGRNEGSAANANAGMQKRRRRSGGGGREAA